MKVTSRLYYLKHIKTTTPILTALGRYIIISLSPNTVFYQGPSFFILVFLVSGYLLLTDSSYMAN